MTMTRVATGSTSPDGFDHGAVPGTNTETAGNRCQITAAKMTTRMTATTNSGSAVMASAPTESTWSSTLSRRAAASTPRPTPSTVPITPARITSTAEFTIRPPTRVPTDVPLASEVPKSPCRMPVSQVQYYSTAG